MLENDEPLLPDHVILNVLRCAHRMGYRAERFGDVIAIARPDGSLVALIGSKPERPIEALQKLVDQVWVVS